MRGGGGAPKRLPSVYVWSGCGPAFGITYAARPATDAISTAPLNAFLEFHETVRGSILEGGGPTRERARVKSVRGVKWEGVD